MKRAMIGTVVVVVTTATLHACGAPPMGECTEACLNAETLRACRFDRIPARPDEERCGDGRSCVENVRTSGEPYAACAIGGVPDPLRRCERDGERTYCDGNTWVSCHGKYRIETFDCAERACVEVGDEARCALSSEPDPRCDPARRSSTYCDGDGVVTCFGPYAWRAFDCREKAMVCRGDRCEP